MLSVVPASDSVVWCVWCSRDDGGSRLTPPDAKVTCDPTPGSRVTVPVTNSGTPPSGLR